MIGRNCKRLRQRAGMTQEELAIFLGMHRATLVRALRVLRGCGALLQLTKNRLRIGDLALLQKIAGE